MSEIKVGYVVYRVPATGSWSHGSRTGSRYDWLACGTPLGCRRRRRSLRRLQPSGVKMVSKI